MVVLLSVSKSGTTNTIGDAKYPTHRATYASRIPPFHQGAKFVLSATGLLTAERIGYDGNCLNYVQLSVHGIRLLQFVWGGYGQCRFDPKSPLYNIQSYLLNIPQRSTKIPNLLLADRLFSKSYSSKVMSAIFNLRVLWRYCHMCFTLTVSTPLCLWSHSTGVVLTVEGIGALYEIMEDARIKVNYACHWCALKAITLEKAA